MNAFLQFWYFSREYLFPRGCGICGSMLVKKQEAWYGLCDECRNGLAFEGAINSDPAIPCDTIERCDLCGRPLISEIGRCLTCRAIPEDEQPAYDRIVSLFPYIGKYQKLLAAFKFGKSLSVGHFLAEQLIDALKLLPLNGMNDFALVPVPPRPGKIRKTGWDQIASLSKLVKQMLDSPKIMNCLERRASQTQKKLGKKERMANLKGRIVAKGKVPKYCLLFDDVITTGATMDACAAALKAGGAEKVYGVCLFYD